MCPSLALLDLIKEIATTALSAFAGAWAAFLFERKREEKQDEGERYRQLRYAHFATLSQFSELRALQAKVLSKFKGREDAWRMLHPLLAQFTTPTFVPGELAFLLESSDPDLINRLTIGQQKFESVKGTLAFRNQYHQEFQAQMAALLAQGITTMPSEAELHNAIGKDLVGKLKGTTEALFEEVEETLTFLEKNLGDLEAFARKEYPKRRVPKYSLPTSGDAK